MRISPATPISDIPLEAPHRIVGSEPSEGAGFLDVLSQAREAEAKADDAANRFAAGDPAVGIHEVVIEAEQASVMLHFAVTLKNKAIEAYRELMNTPV